MLQAKSGKELMVFLMNDFLLLAQGNKSFGSNHLFLFDRQSSIQFKIYKKVCLHTAIKNVFSCRKGTRSPQGYISDYHSIFRLPNALSPYSILHEQWQQRCSRLKYLMLKTVVTMWKPKTLSTPTSLGKPSIFYNVLFSYDFSNNFNFNNFNILSFNCLVYCLVKDDCSFNIFALKLLYAYISNF